MCGNASTFAQVTGLSMQVRVKSSQGNQHVTTWEKLSYKCEVAYRNLIFTTSAYVEGRSNDRNQVYDKLYITSI